MHILNEKLYGDFAKLPANVKKVLVKPEVLKELSRAGIEQESSIASKTFTKGTNLIKAIGIVAKELEFDAPRAVLFQYGNNVYGFVNSWEPIKSKTALARSSRISQFGFREYDKEEAKFVLATIEEFDEFTVYVLKHVNESKRQERNRNKVSGDKYAPGIYGGPSDFMRRAKDKDSYMRVKHAQSKLNLTKEYDITLTNFKSLQNLLEIVSKNDAKSIKVDGIYLHPFSFNEIGFKDSVRIRGEEPAIKELIKNGTVKVGSIKGHKEPVDVYMEVEGNKYKYSNFDILAIDVNGEIRHTIAK